MIKKIFIACVAMSLFACKQRPTYDTIIRHATVYDGTGSEAIKADIAINNDTIAFIGDLSDATAKFESDANGLAVAPGFIDAHSHHGGGIFNQRGCPAAISQGITTIIVGQDGGSYSL